MNVGEQIEWLEDRKEWLEDMLSEDDLDMSAFEYDDLVSEARDVAEELDYLMSKRQRYSGGQ